MRLSSQQYSLRLIQSRAGRTVQTIEKERILCFDLLRNPVLVSTCHMDDMDDMDVGQ